MTDSDQSPVEPTPPEQPLPPGEDEATPQAEVAQSEVGSKQADAVARQSAGRRTPTEREMKLEGQLAELQARLDELELRRSIGRWLSWLLLGQLVLSNVIFVVYCWVNGWQIDPGVMQVWSGATVVQVVGLAWVVVKYLFSATAAPDGPGRRSGPLS